MNLKPTSELAQHFFEAASDHAAALGEQQPPAWVELSAIERETFTEGLRPVLAVTDDEWRTALATILDNPEIDNFENLKAHLRELITTERN